MVGASDIGLGTARHDESFVAPPRLPLRAAFVLVLLFLLGATLTSDLIALVLLTKQDIWLLGIGLFTALLALLPFRNVQRPLSLDRWSLALIILGAAVLTFAGHRLLLSGYDFTRDEQMVNFDAAIFRSGRMAWPLPLSWQAHAPALNLRFMLPVTQPVAWVSAYLPMHALMRAGLGAFTEPLLTALSIPLLWACARRLWPEQRETATVCVLLLVSAGQFIFAGMTAYAMPAHLFCNLLWFSLFLRDRRLSDLGALLVGVVGTGLHQPLFHPMFVAPFILLLLVERRWERLALFASGYLLIGMFWLYWPIYMHGRVAGPLAVDAVSNAGYVARLISALSTNSDNISTMAANMLRFCTWQNPLLLPLMLASWPAIRRSRLAVALALGFLLPAIVMTVLLPSQGYGFGYRYFHGVLGNALLLAGYGWNTLTAGHAALRSTLLRAVAASLLLLLPVQAWMAHRLYAPFARASARIDASDADYAIIREGHMALLHDLVLNRPDLSNRPIRLLDPLIGDPRALARLICRPGVHVVIADDDFFRPLTTSLGLPNAASNSRRLRQQASILQAAGCTVSTLD